MKSVKWFWTKTARVVGKGWRDISRLRSKFFIFVNKKISTFSPFRDIPPIRHRLSPTAILRRIHPIPSELGSLSGERSGQYWGGGPPGKPLGCCWLFCHYLIVAILYTLRFEFVKWHTVCWSKNILYDFIKNQNIPKTKFRSSPPD